MWENITCVYDRKAIFSLSLRTWQVGTKDANFLCKRTTFWKHYLTWQTRRTQRKCVWEVEKCSYMCMRVHVCV